MQLNIKSLLISPLVLVAAACGTVPSAPSQSTLTDMSVEGRVVASGTFSGRNDHVVKGSVEVIEEDGAIYLRLGEGFSLDGAPDPRIGFGRSGEYDTSTTFSNLDRIAGEQTYILPESFQLGTLNEATIWCDDFSVALGTASLK